MRTQLISSVFLTFTALPSLALSAEDAAWGWARDVYLNTPAIRYLPQDLDPDSPNPSVIVFDLDAGSPDEITDRFRIWERSNEIGAEINHIGGKPVDATVQTKDAYLIEWLLDASIEEGHIIPEQSIVVTYAGASEHALRYVCNKGGKIGALVMIDYEADFTLDCQGPIETSIYSIHQPDQDGFYAEIITQMRSAGATAGSLTVSPGAGYEPSFNARVFQQFDVTIEDIVMSVAAEVIP